MGYESEADVLGYGGAAGGGKTDLLLGLALTRHRVSILFRREAKQLRAVIDRARSILGNTGRFNENTGIWRGLPGGGQLEFGGVKDPGDEQAYRGRPHDFIGFDEADQFLEFQVRFLQGWLRTTTVGQRCRVVIAFNPPATPAGRWLVNYFAPWIDRKHPSPARQGEPRWYATLPDGKEVERPDGSPFGHAGETIQPKSRTFIQARVQDNKFLMRTGYLATLQALPEPLRSQVLYGDMMAGVEDDAWQVIPTSWVEASMTRWKPDGKGGVRLEALGVDCARGGKAQTVLAKRYGHWIDRLEKHPGHVTRDGDAVAALVQKAILGWQSVLVNLDVIGIGASPYDSCRRLLKGALVYPVNFAEATEATDTTRTLRFRNVRAFGYWSLRELLDPNRPERDRLILPPDPELLADLTTPHWKMGLSGVQIEAKEDIEKQLGRSIDCGDSVVYSILTAPAGYFAAGGPTRLVT